MLHLKRYWTIYQGNFLFQFWNLVTYTSFSRFIINVPEAELASVERICFQVEQAHWFYEDFIRELKPELPSFQLKTFSARIFKHCPLLHQWAHEHERTYADFMQYRFRIPVCGAIILNANLDKCVLVKGWSSKSGWGFPKGKINQEEEYDCCAIREVFVKENDNNVILKVCLCRYSRKRVMILDLC